MASVIELDSEIVRMVLQNKTDGSIRKAYPYATKVVMKEVRDKLMNEIVEIPSGIKMITELDSMVVTTREFLTICKNNNDVKLGLEAIRTMAKVVDSFSRVYDVAKKADERKKDVTQQEFDTLIDVLQRVLKQYPDVAQEFADALKERGMKDKSQGFEPDWEVVEDLD